jgi:hypothetical protein
MIIGLDHITLNTNSLINETEYFKKRDYKIFFKQNIKNHKNKFNFLRQENKYHKTIFLKKKKNNSIELTKYKLNHNQVKNLTLKDNLFTCLIKNLDKEKKFLKNILNFNIIENYAYLKTFSKELSFKVKLKKINKNHITFLDDIGFVCICLISTDIQRVIKDCRKNNLLVSKKFFLNVNQKKLKICLIKSPNNLLYEIIEFKK